ncbi:hypothetical protein SAMN02745244_02982 [Tessaracoccus bendigoensis DSM 12906]|uniref:Uncharacterized protein n=1 Tax=Tessaracoccus bendigoensis DSM 12906 TaxID=1123357 RepID=A0A1M6L3J9_9ACTN|nr:hypothetical protein SAMN02745244_02982 [Tessaracoccus bendigoensis DSM 12906]
MNPRDSPRSRSKGRWSQRRPLVAVLLAVDTSLLTSTPAERLATGYPAPIPAQRLATSDPPPIPAQRLATSGIQLVSSDTAGIGHQSLVSTTINSTSVASRHTPWVTPGRQPGARHQRSTADTSGKARHQRSTADTCGKARHQRYTAGIQRYCWYRPQIAGVHADQHRPAARRTSTAGLTVTQPGAAATPVEKLVTSDPPPTPAERPPRSPATQPSNRFSDSRRPHPSAVRWPGGWRAASVVPRWGCRPQP